MNGSEVADLVARRYEALTELMQMTYQQKSAVEAGRMNELMQLLAEKQQPLERLNLYSKQLHHAIQDDPEARAWVSQSIRSECRHQHEKCEKMLAELMEMEVDCERQLEQSRTRIEEEILRSDGAIQANQVYNRSHHTPSTGGQLDLSSG
ncbi:FlgN protein [Novipirellula aureliae]|uniref:FlgN protein n=1 Tax=Novipirellula aureliae TaxID=2527966 RepID=A0A5C6E4H1_9BACT|nr:flagellar export chaperone FlgN [Novipirellula aureliae]TWU43822.1 FlgN protein [Novipirellula aureliae]